MSAPTLTTIGYEGALPLEVIGALKDAGVHTLIDIRAVAMSRRPGFSKTALKNALEQNGLGYIHLRDLGTPKQGREAARAGNTSEMHRIFNAHMQTPEAQVQLVTAVELATSKPCCLLCFEHDYHGCHRFIVANAIRRHVPLECVHLRPQVHLPGSGE